MKRVVIIGDCDVEFRLAREVQALGATGYTCYRVHGEGARGIRPRHAESGNMKMEIIATVEVADGILEHVAKHYLDNYPMIGFIDEVEVLHGEKFTAKPR